MQYILFGYCALCAWFFVELEDKYMPSYYLNLFILNFFCLPLVLFSQIQCIATEPSFEKSNKINLFYGQLNHLIYVLYKIEEFFSSNKNNLESNFNNELSTNLYKIKENLYYLEKYFINSEQHYDSLNITNSQVITSDSYEIESRFTENMEKINEIMFYLIKIFTFLGLTLESCRFCKGLKYEKTHHCSICNK